MFIKVEELDGSMTRVKWTFLIRNKKGFKNCLFKFGQQFHPSAPNMEVVCEYSLNEDLDDEFNYHCSQCGFEHFKNECEDNFEISLYLMQTIESSSQSSSDSAQVVENVTLDPINTPSAVWASINDGDKKPLKMKESSSSLTTGKWATEKFSVNLEIDEYCDESDKQYELTCVFWIQFETISQGGKNVLKHLSDLFDQQIDCDVQFEFEDAKKIGGHVNILAVRSPSFANIFHKMAKTTPRKVKITDVQLEIFQDLLRFIYSGRICTPMYESKAKSLYLAACKYQIDDLKKVCSDFLCQSISMSNAINMLIWAHMFSVDELKAAALQLVSQHGGELCRSQEWEEMARNHIDLCILATRRLMK